MKCEICGKEMKEGATLYRVNGYGVIGVWRCDRHHTKPIAPEVKAIVQIIEEDNRRKEEQ